jgi:predicted alpha/beta superfamily hydrolase
MFANLSMPAKNNPKLSPNPLILNLLAQNDDVRPVFLTGNFNDWKVRDERFQMTCVSPGKYEFKFGQNLKTTNEPLEYKYVKGGWEGEELDQNGHPTRNRRLEMSAGKVTDVVQNWKTAGSIFYPQIEVISTRFNIPQLKRRRRISVLLPWNYYQSERNYPVLYLQDGQNLFEEQNQYGTWGVDKALAHLAEKGKGDFIVVAIDHGGRDRIKEFSPYPNNRWGAGLGKEYVRFLVETLKPHIDKNFRTMPEREHTGVGGSSLGGLISIYAGLMFPHSFSKLMVFSPSFWAAQKIFFEPIRFFVPVATKIYLYGGGKEGANMIGNIARFRETIARRGFDQQIIDFNVQIDPNGGHNEQRWGTEFPRAAEWLFA